MFCMLSGANAIIRVSTKLIEKMTLSKPFQLPMQRRRRYGNERIVHEAIPKKDSHNLASSLVPYGREGTIKREDYNNGIVSEG